MYAKKRYPWLTVLIIVLCLILLGVGWYLFDTNVDRSGWVNKDGVYSYRDFHGKKVTGWQDIDGKRYYFDEEKIMTTHWLEQDGSRYYFGRDGALDIGWLKIDGQRYYSDENGVIQTGWQDIDYQRYYLNEDGTLHTGWLEDDGFTYYFGEDGTMALGLVTLDAGTYYFDVDGSMRTGAVTIEEHSYFFEEDGIMHTGWLETENGKCYYLPDSGILATGWQEIEEKNRFFGEDGIMQTGWVEQGEYSYYLLEDGTAATGPQEINGSLHYFTPKGIHVVLVNSKHKVPDYYTMNLVKIDGWHQVSDVCYDALRTMLDDCKAAVGYYEFNSGYRSINDQQAILEQRTEENMTDGTSYGAARAIALRSVAVPGTSEHHLGLAVDILGDAAKAWLQEHCWDYGFIVRYLENKSHITGIMYEPWHFRYVGTEVSLDMKDSGLCLEEYLGAHPIEVPEESTEETGETAEGTEETGEPAQTDDSEAA